MPFGEEVGRFFVRVVWEVVLYSIFQGTGWVVIKLFTAGQKTCSDDVTTLIGMLTWAVLIAGFFVFR